MWRLNMIDNIRWYGYIYIYMTSGWLCCFLLTHVQSYIYELYYTRLYIYILFTFNAVLWRWAHDDVSLLSSKRRAVRCSPALSHPLLLGTRSCKVITCWYVPVALPVGVFVVGSVVLDGNFLRLSSCIVVSWCCSLILDCHGHPPNFSLHLPLHTGRGITWSHPSQCNVIQW